MDTSTTPIFIFYLFDIKQYTNDEFEKVFSILKETYNKPCHKTFRKINNLKIYAFEKRFCAKNYKETCPKEKTHTYLEFILTFISQKV